MAHKGRYYIGNELFVYTRDVSTDGVTPIGNVADSSVFAYSTECTLSISADQIDTSNKQSGVWASALPGQLSWSISTSALYTNENNYSTLFSKFERRDPLYVEFGEITALGDSSTAMNTSIDASAGYYAGVAYITSLELNAGNNEVASFSVEFTGEGKLERKTS